MSIPALRLPHSTFSFGNCGCKADHEENGKRGHIYCGAIAIAVESLMPEPEHAATGAGADA